MLSSSHVGPNVPGNVSKQIPGKPALSKVQSAAPQVPQHAKGSYVAKEEEKRSEADLNASLGTHRLYQLPLHPCLELAKWPTHLQLRFMENTSLASLAISN